MSRLRDPLVLVPVGLVVVVALIGIVRLAVFGWDGIAPDDARYLYVGLSTFAGDGPVTPNGNLFLLRSPVYGILLAVGGQFTENPVEGARIVAALLALGVLVAAVGLGWLMGGRWAAVVTALAILAMPLLWELLPTLRIDLAQTAGVLAVLICLRRPTARRWALAGVLLGLTVLVKETVALLALAPLAAMGLVPGRRLTRLWLVYVATGTFVAAWWWILVWSKAGVLFPFNAIGVIERRDVGTDILVDPLGITLVAIMAVAWLAVVRRSGRLDVRLLVGAAACLAPPAAYATFNGLGARNYAGLAVLSAVAIGVAAANMAGVRSHLGASRRAGAAVLALSAAVMFTTAAQLGVRDPAEPQMPKQISAWLRDHIEPGDRIVMTFRYHELIALELFGIVDAPELSARRVSEDEALADYLWMGLRDQQLFGYRRDQWQAMLTPGPTRYLVLAGPHALTPDELVGALDAGAFPGIRHRASFDEGDSWARVYSVDPKVALATPLGPSIHISPNAALAWLDFGGRDERQDRRRQVIDARPVLVGRGYRRVLNQLGPRACAVPTSEPGRTFRIVPAAEARGQPGVVCGS